MSKEIITVDETKLLVKEWDGQRVISLSDVDKLHKRSKGVAKSNFKYHKNKFTEGTDYYETTVRDLSASMGEKNILSCNPNFKIVLLTKTGYLLLVKTMNDPIAWEIQKRLVEAYFVLEKVMEGKVANKAEDNTKLPVVASEPWQIMLQQHKEMLDKETSVNEQFRENITRTMDALISMIENQSKLLNSILNISKLPQPVENDEVVVEENTEETPDNSSFSTWKAEINNITSSASNRNKTLRDTYIYMNKNYGVCWSQERKDFYDENGRAPQNTLELIYWMETSGKGAYKNLFESCLHTIISREKEIKEDALNIFPARSFEHIRDCVEKICDFRGFSKAQHGTAVYKGFFSYADKKLETDWDYYRMKYKTQYNPPKSLRVSKVMMLAAFPELVTKYLPVFNAYVKEFYNDMIYKLN